MRVTGGQRQVSLTRLATPYLGQSVILGGITVLATYAADRTSEWRIMWGVAVIWAFFVSFVVFIGMKYRVLWDETGLVMRASGIQERKIRFDEITEVEKETAPATEFLSQARPFRRIVVRGRRDDPNAFIDISTRHFRPKDIETLLVTIHSRRPDIAVPEL